MMREGDRIYIAKYYEELGKWEIAKSYGVRVKKIEEEVEGMKKSKVYERYKKMSDREWEEIEERENENRKEYKREGMK